MGIDSPCPDQCLLPRCIADPTESNWTFDPMRSLDGSTCVLSRRPTYHIHAIEGQSESASGKYIIGLRRASCLFEG